MNPTVFRPKNRFTSFSSFLFILWEMMAAGTAIPVLAEDEPEVDEGLFIVSTTEKISAGLARRLQEGPSSPNDNMNEDTDRKRKEVGIGESVSLELRGKRKGSNEKVTWSYVGNAGTYVELPNSPKGNPVTMTVKKSFDSDQSATIKVTNQNGESREISFNLRVPHEFKGTHKKVSPFDPFNDQAGVVPQLKDDTGKVVNPQSGETGTIGASADLLVTVNPVEVSFENITMIERANDPKGFKPEHQPNPNSWTLDGCNRFTDHIFSTSYSSPSDPVPAGWTWQCAYMIVENKRDTFKMTGKDIPQTTIFSKTGTASAPGVETTVSKFGCSVSRDSLTGEHRFTPNTYQP